MRGLYDAYWYELFEEDEEGMDFWSTTQSAGRVKRANLE